MPYMIRKRGNKWCVLKKSGEVKSCKFTSKDSAMKYFRFLEMYHQWEKGKGKKPRGVS